MINKRQTLLLVALTAFTVVSSCKSESKGDAVTLQLNLEKGQQYSMEMTVNSTANTMGMDITTDMNMEMTMNVDDVDNEGIITVSTSYDHIVFEQNMPMMGKLRYDSDDPDAASGTMSDVYKEAFEPILNAHLTMKMDKHGKVVDIEGLDELTEELAQGQLPDLQSNFKENMDYFFAVFPEDPVHVGDSWARTLSLKSQFPMQVETTYTLQEIKDGKAIISVTGNLSMDEGNSVANQTGLKSLEGTLEGEMAVDISTGWTVRGDIEQDLKLGVEQMGQSIEMDIVNEISFKSK